MGFFAKKRNDYYPFGMLLPNRHDDSSDYRYGFQGQEKDDELKGEGNSINYKFRMHDPRVGRFFTIDPLTAKYPYLTPYQFSSNQPIHAVELEGLESADEIAPNPKMNRSRHVLKSLGVVSKDGRNTVLLDDITPTSMQELYDEALKFNVKDGNVTLKNGQKWYIRTSDGKFHPAGGTGTVELGTREYKALGNLRKQMMNADIANEKAVDNFLKAVKGQGLELSEDFTKSIAKMSELFDINPIDIMQKIDPSVAKIVQKKPAIQKLSQAKNYGKIARMGLLDVLDFPLALYEASRTSDELANDPNYPGLGDAEIYNYQQFGQKNKPTAWDNFWNLFSTGSSNFGTVPSLGREKN